MSNHSVGTPEILEPCPYSKDAIVRLLNEKPLPTSQQQQRFAYGTAGFRYDASLLPGLMVRVGLFVACRSRSKQHQQQQQQQSQCSPSPIGLMVTASHNDESYNGCKICEATGDMLAPDGEELVVQVANESNISSLLDLLDLNKIDSTLTATAMPAAAPAIVHIGRDTRSHSEQLANLAIAAARAAGAVVYNHGLITTPCLHHCVLHSSDKLQHLPSSLLIPQSPNEQGYYALLAKSYTSLLATGAQQLDPQLATAPLLVDCACGIGYVALQQLVHEIQQQHRQCNRRIIPTNRPTSGPLNEDCGSEHVQKTIQPPTWFNNPPIQNKSYCASLDGDADRIVFFSETSDSENDDFILLDGDKIAALVCNFLQSQFDALQSSCGGDLEMPKLGVVQTAYANGASTAYLRQQVFGDPDRVKIAKTGVKYVHTMAHNAFDVGVYFEANGHGTVLFGNKFYRFIEQARAAVVKNTSSSSSSSTNDTAAAAASAAKTALTRLELLPCLINQAVGDALSDLLLVDAILQLQQQSIRDWNKDLYQDLPSRQAKVRVRDRTIITTNDNETKCLAPAAVQPALDKAVASIAPSNGRAFIRPSGTEDVVRVYAEASTRQQADALAQQACDIIDKLCGGVGGQDGKKDDADGTTPPALNSNL